MKKLMIAVAAVACATVGFADDITSNNIVGYNGKQTGEHLYSFFGGTFVPVSGAKQYRLVDVTVENCTPGDLFQLINGDSLMNLDGTYSYVSSEFSEAAGGEDIGWYDLDKGDVFDPAAKVSGDDVLVDVGRGFLGDLQSGQDVKFTFNGEAPTTTTEIETSGSQYAMVVNYIPRAIPLNWVVPSGAITPGDLIQKVNSDNLMNLDATYAYVSANFSEAAGGEDIGWYDLDKGDVFDPAAKIDDNVLFQPNDAYLCDMSSSLGDASTFQFPSSTKKTN